MTCQSEYNLLGVLVTSSFCCNSQLNLNKQNPGTSISRSVDRRHDRNAKRAGIGFQTRTQATLPVNEHIEVCRQE